jgi:hypothetical protein
MTAPAIVLSISGLVGVLALVLAFASRGLLARRLAIASLWLALAAVPASIGWDLLAPPDPADANTDKLALALSHVKNYGALVMPFAGFAMIAMRRASAVSSRRRS